MVGRDTWIRALSAGLKHLFFSAVVHSTIDITIRSLLYVVLYVVLHVLIVLYVHVSHLC